MSSSHVSHLFDLSGKRAVVTGVRRGIGLAIATSLAREGARASPIDIAWKLIQEKDEAQTPARAVRPACKLAG